ncbi:SDR family oxidoreductase [Oleiagrimonas sp.]|jgi:uncharacterized protein YbjT (DUF2867 family)|uniref:SDR family oxidoreductase n=1 Tax=Oleiagrimonas sp. TaxID=2010330 RepID=UPI0026207813|nr:SDR family oxidoreductase [Oleiagrimonas sp.]MDA3912952.1 SDR family oxidoreductase [Oleiagrimonas sp.]
MLILVAGANGQIGRQLLRRIKLSLNHSRAMIRDAGQSDTLRTLGADETIVADLEGDVRPAMEGCDAVVFTAGSGGQTGPEKTDAVDRDGAIGLIDACKDAGIQRFVMVSSMGTDDPDNGPEGLRHYLQAKQAADKHLADSGLDYTIVRPGRLTDDVGSGKVAVSNSLGRSGSVPRADVAAVLMAVLQAPETAGMTFELLAGQTPVREAIAAL